MPFVEPVTADSLAFATLFALMICVAWSRARAWFLPALLVCSCAVLATWLKPLDLLVLALFLGVPFLLIRSLWGNQGAHTRRLAAIVILSQTVVFIYLRKYEWIGDYPWLDHPVAIVGLSYMLFRIIHLIIEAPYLGHLSFGPVRYVTYVTSFWTIISGPIQRYEDFTTGLKEIGRPEPAEVVQAGHRLINGLIKAFVIAPIFLKMSDISVVGAPDANWLDFAIVLYAYPAYLYLNFSGYTDLVVAGSRLCGFRTMPENFNKPYLARNLLDFWSRWHMSFGTWIRQYVFNPMSKHLLHWGPRRFENLFLAFSILATFILVGVWHGTTANFVVFGLLHGLGIILISFYGYSLKALIGPKRRRAFLEHPFVKGVSVLFCFHFVCGTILLFPNRIEELHTAFGQFFIAQGWL